MENRTITKVYASDTASIGQEVQAARFIILELSPDDPGAALISSPFGNGPGGSGGDGPGGPGSPASGPPRRFPSPTLKAASAMVTQTGLVTAVSRATYKPSAVPVATTAVRNLIVDDFRQLKYQDPNGGGTLQYNLFVPRNYDKSKNYPLVLFVHDAGTLSSNPLVTLAQGLGAVVWASPEDQSKRECFVLAPQFSSVAEGEKSGPGSAMDQIIGLIKALPSQYSIDTTRLYATGQSMGAMLSIAMNIAHPGFFAASYLVAGQWDAEQSRPLAKDKLWIVVSEGDERAYPGENVMTAVWEQEGARISRAVWNGRATPEEFAADVQAMGATKTTIHYVALQKGTVVPPTQLDNAASNHINTWRIAYTIEGIRDWLFRQQK